MFRLKYIKLGGHPQLKDIELVISEDGKINELSSPYTSVIIGANGTGKSYILRTIAEIFRHLKRSSLTDKFEFNLPFDVELNYIINNNSYKVIVRRIPHKRNKEASFFKNLPHVADFNWSVDFVDEYRKYFISHKELEFPEKLIVNSVMLTDRFLWKNSNHSDFYQYLGARSTKTTSSTKSSSRRTIKYLLSSITTNSDFIGSLKELLNFLEFEESFKVHYTTKINKLFFSGQLNISNFKKYFEAWWEDDFTFSKRKKENPIWSIPYYNNNFRDNPEKLEEIVSFLNYISNSKNGLEHKRRSPAKILPIDIFNTDLDFKHFELIGHLENLDIINLDGIKVRKSNSSLSINEVSSGEYHLLISLIGMFASISQNSLVLIDEPEISLHPNWQMRYISFLKQVFSKFSTAHFILTTHSHFIVSDLEGQTSSVTALRRDDKTNKLEAEFLKGTDTYGWSPDDVLYNVFGVTSSRNKFVAEEIAEILEILSRGDKEKVNTIPKGTFDKLKYLENSLKFNDPLREVVVSILKKVIL